MMEIVLLLFILLLLQLLLQLVLPQIGERRRFLWLELMDGMI